MTGNHNPFLVVANNGQGQVSLALTFAHGTTNVDVNTLVTQVRVFFGTDLVGFGLVAVEGLRRRGWLAVGRR